MVTTVVVIIAIKQVRAAVIVVTVHDTAKLICVATNAVVVSPVAIVTQTDAIDVGVVVPRIAEARVIESTSAIAVACVVLVEAVAIVAKSVIVIIVESAIIGCCSLWRWAN